MIMFFPIPMHMSGQLDPFSFIGFMIMLAIILFVAVYHIIDILMLNRWHNHKEGGGSCSYTIFIKDGKVIR